MGYANHIGRVGALAVALGIGAAVATQPGIGWAQDGGSSPDSNSGSSSASDSGGSQQQSDQSQAGPSQSSDSSSSSPSSDPTPSSPSEEPSGSSTTIGGGSSPDVTISSSGGALTSGGAPSSSGDADPATGGADVIESSGTGTGQQGTPPAGGESAPVDTAASAGTSGEAHSPAGSHNDINAASQQGSTGGSTNPQQGDDSGNSVHSLSVAASNTNNQDEDESGQSFRTVSTFSAMSTLDAPAVSPAVAPAQDPISALLAIPAAFINAAANIVINFFEPFVAPGGPFENAALFALLEVTRRQFGQSFANSTPNIGPDISLTVDENSAGKSIGTLPAADVDGDTITYTVDPTDGPEHGTVTIVGNAVTYKPTTGYSGADGFTLVGNDGGGHIYAPGQGPTDTATVSITVEATGPNTAPVATNDTYSLDVGQTVTASALAGVLANDTDADAGDTLTAVKVTDPTKGTLTFNADGSFSYTATAPGIDSFTYKANDGQADSNTATVTITNTAVPTNTPPVATADTYSATVGTPLSVTAPNGVLHNDTDADAGDTLTAVKVTDPSKGGVTLNADGSFTYTANAGATGTDTFTYKANDGQADSNAVTVTITLNATTPANTPPVATADTYSATVGTPLSVTAPNGVLHNDTDADAGDTLTAVKVTDPSKGGVTLNADGSFTYTANAGATGTDTFTYKANDGQADSNTVTVTITLNATTPVNTPPVATADTYSATVGTPLSVTAPNGVLHNDTDADAGDTLTAVKVTDPSKGGVTLNADGSFTYTANAGATGTDTFTYKANDGQADSNTVTVTITLNATTPANTPPVATADTYSATVGTPLSVTAPNGVLHNDTDADAGDTLTAVKVTDPSKGGVTLNADGSFTYTANAGATGTDTFTYKANDGQADSNAVTVIITLNAVQTGQPPSVLGTSNLPGTALSTAVTGPNGVTYQTITKNYSTTSATTSVYAIDPDHPGNPVAIVTDAAGEQRGGLVFGPNGTAYQTTFVYAQPGVNQQQVHVTVINLNSPSATPPVVTINNAENALFDPAIAVGSDGKAYQLSTTSTGTGTTLHLTVIDPAHPELATTADFAGATKGFVSVAGGKTFLTYETPDGSDATTRVVSINPASPQSPTTVVEILGQTLTTPLVSSDGRVFVTTYSSTFSATDGTHIRIINPSDLSHPGSIDVPAGVPFGRAVEGPGGVVYVPVSTSAIVGTGFVQTVKVYVFNSGQTAAAASTIDVPGQAVRDPAVGADGRIYIATSVLNPVSITSTYYVNVVDPAHPGTVVSVPIDQPSQSTGLAVGSDGKAYLTTIASSNSTASTTHLVVINPASATPQVIDVNGDHSANLGADVTIGPDGLVYLTTVTTPISTGDNTTHVTVIDPHTAGNPIIKTLDIVGSPIGNVVFDSDGIGYQTTSGAAGTRVAVIGVPQM